MTVKPTVLYLDGKNAANFYESVNKSKNNGYNHEQEKRESLGKLAKLYKEVSSK